MVVDAVEDAHPDRMKIKDSANASIPNFFFIAKPSFSIKQLCMRQIVLSISFDNYYVYYLKSHGFNEISRPGWLRLGFPSKWITYKALLVLNRRSLIT